MLCYLCISHPPTARASANPILCAQQFSQQLLSSSSHFLLSCLERDEIKRKVDRRALAASTVLCENLPTPSGAQQPSLLRSPWVKAGATSTAAFAVFFFFLVEIDEINIFIVILVLACGVLSVLFCCQLCTECVSFSVFFFTFFFWLGLLSGGKAEGSQGRKSLESTLWAWCSLPSLISSCWPLPSAPLPVPRTLGRGGELSNLFPMGDFSPPIGSSMRIC